MDGFAFADNYPFEIPAGGRLDLPVNADFLYVSELFGGDLLLESPASRLPLVIGRRVEWPQREAGTIGITNRGSTTAAGVLLIGSGDVRDSSVVGSVSINGPVVIDNPEEMHPGSSELTERGGEFVCSVSKTSGAGEYVWTGIFNPPLSGKKIVLKSVTGSVFGGEVGAIYLKKVSGGMDGELSVNLNKKSGSVETGVAEVKRGVSAEAIGNASYGFWVTSQYERNIEIISQLTSPIILDEGDGALVTHSATNVLCYSVYHWSEVDA